MRDCGFSLLISLHGLIFSKAALPVDVKLAKVRTVHMGKHETPTLILTDDDFGSRISLFGDYRHSGGLSLIQAALSESDG